jgi:pyrroline-5-carboxylate reductase
MSDPKHIGFIGGGNMGEALIKGLLGASLCPAGHIHVFDVSATRLRDLENTHGVRCWTSIAEVAEAAQVIVLAVKPQNMGAVLDGLAPHLARRQLVISIAAGIPISMMAGALPQGLPIIRVMPNTPALILQGASALARGAHASEEDVSFALTLFRSVGTAIEVEEKLMDAVTGLSGSGPGYVLLIIESMIEAGVLLGLPRQVSRELVLQTISGTAGMVKQTGKHPAELRDLITSPGGTTIRGLHVLEERNVRGALMSAVEAATLRSMELGKK